MALNDTFSASILNSGNKARESFSLKCIFFLIQNKRVWLVLSEASENIEEKLDQVCRIIKRGRSLTWTFPYQYTHNDKRKYPDDEVTQTNIPF